MRTTIAIFSPNQNAYSETFIRAHKSLPFNIRFYYNGLVPQALEGMSMLDLNYWERFQKRILKGFNLAEKKLIFSLKKQKVQAVLTEYGGTAVESLNVLKYLNIPLVAHFHGYDASVYSVLEHHKEGYRKVFDYASAVIAVSQKMKQDLIKIGCPDGKITWTPCAPADAFFKLQLRYRSKQFISIGRFVEKKAPHLTILAFQKVVKHFPDAELKMIGDGLLFPFCQDLVMHLGLAGQVKLMGVQPADVIRQEMEGAIAFVQHSVTASNGDSEGTPVAVLEAQAAALPVIATRHAGIPDVVLHEETGLLCNEKDVDAMAANMMRILADNNLARKLGQAGRERIKNHFTMDKHLSILTEVIEKAVQIKPGQDLQGSA